MGLWPKLDGSRRSALAAEVAGYVEVARFYLRREGLGSTLTRLGRFLKDRAARPQTIAQRRGQTFTVGSATLSYELGRYNGAWLTERSVEISLAKHVLHGIQPSDVLEVGNVLTHFGRSKHTVVDKYDKRPNVLNEDILDYRPGRTFDAIVAVSTIEHVGFDQPETPDSEAPTKALAALRDLLSPTGFLLVTVPFGYNAGLDASIASGRFACERQFCLQRVSADNDWREIELAQALGAGYGAPYADGNVLFVGLDGPGVAAARL